MPRRVAVAVVAALGWPAIVQAHGSIPADPPTLAGLVLSWQLDPLIGGALLAAALAWLVLVRRVNQGHPARQVPVRRSVAFLGGLATVAVALMSGIERYDTTLFSVHMVQHLLLMLVAAPLIALGAPVTLVLRAASPRVRARWLIPALHSGPLAAIGHPIVAWLAFTLVMWLSHFTALFDLALEDRGVHQVEHAVFVTAALLFWWPLIAADPSRRRLPYPVRALYVLLQLPVNSFLGMAILFAPAPLYAHYATLGSPYGISALADQQIAGGIMWLAGDVVFIGAVLAVVAAWMRHEERNAPAAERRADAQRTALSDRADELARTRGDRLV